MKRVLKQIILEKSTISKVLIMCQRNKVILNMPEFIAIAASYISIQTDTTVAL